MSEQTRRLWRGGARALVGVLIIGVSVAVALVLGTGLVPIAGVERGVVSVQVDTGRSSQLHLVCTGAFAELGADPTQPGTAVPGGQSMVLAAGDAHEASELSREIPLGSAPVALAAGAGASLAAAEIQLVQTSTLLGLAASACAEPVHEQWLVGGATALGVSTTLVLGNPFGVPATVEIAVYDAAGRVDSQQTAGVLVPAESQRIVSMNGYAPAQDRIAVKVTSTGAAVTAALGVSQTVDIRSFAVDSVTRQLAPTTTLIFPGVTNALSHEHSEGDSLSETDEFPVVARVLAPGGAGGTANVYAILPSGAREALGSVDFGAAQVVEFAVPHWPEAAQAMIVEADQPIVGGVQGSADLPPQHDYTWFSPAPVLPANEDVAAAIVPGGELVLMNPGELPASVVLSLEDGRAVQTVNVPAGAAISVAVDGALSLRSTEPVAAAVRTISGAHITGYPVFAPSDAAPHITVYTR